MQNVPCSNWVRINSWRSNSIPHRSTIQPTKYVIWVCLKIGPKSSGQPSFPDFLIAIWPFPLTHKVPDIPTPTQPTDQTRGQFRPLPKPPHSTGKHKVGMPLTSCENRCMGLMDDLWMISLSIIGFDPEKNGSFPGKTMGVPYLCYCVLVMVKNPRKASNFRRPVLANCDCRGHHAVNQVVRQHQINVTYQQ